MAKLKRIKIHATPTPIKGLCPVRPPLDGSKGNPMAWCTKRRGHSGKHSWQLR